MNYLKIFLMVGATLSLTTEVYAGTDRVEQGTGTSIPGTPVSFDIYLPSCSDEDRRLIQGENNDTCVLTTQVPFDKFLPLPKEDCGAGAQPEQGTSNKCTDFNTLTGIILNDPKDEPLELDVGETFDDPGAEAHDLIDGDLTSSIRTTESVDTSVPGAYAVTYDVNNSGGNQDGVTRLVYVKGDTVYEDAEGGDTSKWFTDDINASINIVYDTNISSNVIELKGTSGNKDQFFLYKNDNNNTWNDRVHTTLSWDMDFNSTFRIDVTVNTPLGDRILRYTRRGYDNDGNQTGNVIPYGLDYDIENHIWVNIDRDLNDDLQGGDESESENELIAIQEIQVDVKTEDGGYGRIDNITAGGWHEYALLNRTGFIKRSPADNGILGDLEAMQYVDQESGMMIADDQQNLVYQIDLDTSPPPAANTGLLEGDLFVAYTVAHPDNNEVLQNCDGADPKEKGFCDPEAIAYGKVSGRSNNDLYVFTGGHPGALSTFRLHKDAPEDDFSINAWYLLDIQYTSAIIINNKFYVSIIDAADDESGKLFEYDWSAKATIGSSVLRTGYEIEDTAYSNGILWVLTAAKGSINEGSITSIIPPGLLYKINFSDGSILESYDLWTYNIKDPRGVEVVGDKLYIGDGYDYDPVDDMTHAVHVFDLP